MGPLLFNVFMNDIGGVITVHHLLFADDDKLFSRNSPVSSRVNLQESLNNTSVTGAIRTPWN